MRTSISLFISLTLALLHPAPALAKTPAPEVFHQFMVDAVMAKTLDRIKGLRSGDDAVRELVPLLKPADRKFATEVLKKIKTFPELTRLNRGYGYTYNGRKMTFVLNDLYSSRYVINDKFRLSYSHDNSFKIQMETAARALGRSLAWTDFFLPRAEALDITGILTGAILTLVIGGIVMPVVDIVRNEYIRPMWDAYYCEGKDLSDYRYAKSCGEYLRWKSAQRSSIPDAMPVPEGREMLPLTPKPPKCYSTESPTFEQEFESADGKELIRRTIQYNESRKATAMVEEMIRPASASRLVYKLNEQGQLFEILEGDKIVLSRDPKKKEIMTAEGYAQMDAFDSVISSVLAAIKLCDEAAQAKLKQAADQPGSLVAKHVLTSDSDTVPAADPGAKTAK